MPKAVQLTCLSPAVKELFAREMETIEDPDLQKIFEELVEIVADCPEGQVVGVDIQETAAAGRRGKRAPTPYNNFIASCAKGGANTLAGCAGIWKTKSDAEKETYRTR